MKELLIMAKSLGGGGSEVALMRPAFCTTWMAIIQACECCWAT